jgi:hypothetical protein
MSSRAYNNIAGIIGFCGIIVTKFRQIPLESGRSEVGPVDGKPDLHSQWPTFG